MTCWRVTYLWHLRAQRWSCDHLRTDNSQVIASDSQISVCPSVSWSFFRLDPPFGSFHNFARTTLTFCIYTPNISIYVLHHFSPQKTTQRIRWKVESCHTCQWSPRRRLNSNTETLVLFGSRGLKFCQNLIPKEGVIHSSMGPTGFRHSPVWPLENGALVSTIWSYLQHVRFPDFGVVASNII